MGKIDGSTKEKSRHEETDPMAALCMLLCTTMAACARREAPQLPTAEVQTQPETPEPTQETEPSQAPEEPDQAVSAHGSAAIHGRTLVVSIFADDAATHWDETTDAADIDQTQEHLRIATEWLTDAVKNHTASRPNFFLRLEGGPRSAVQRQIHRDAGACRRLHVRCRPVIFRRTSPPRS